MIIQNGEGGNITGRVNHYDKRVGITYVYDTENYYDPETKKSKSKRKLVGKLDPVTGEVVPCGKPGRPKANKEETKPDETDYGELYREALTTISIRDRRIAQLEERVRELEEKHSSDYKEIQRLKKRLAKIWDVCEEMMKE